MKGVEVPPGPPVLSPIVAEVYGPDYAGRRRRWRASCARFRDDAHRGRGRHPSDRGRAQAGAAGQSGQGGALGVAQADIVEVVRLGPRRRERHAGACTATTSTKCRCAWLPPERKIRRSSAPDEVRAAVAAAGGALVPVSELVEVRPPAREPIYHKTCCRWFDMTGDMGGRLIRRSTACSISAAGEGDRWWRTAAGVPEWFIHQPDRPYAAYAGQMGRRMADHLRNLPRHGRAYAVGLILIYVLVVAQFRVIWCR